ncbi:multicopy membrane protein [Schizosaccharomyces osmophilus]|uniref:Multicopy membrane protein n=1 Tax=Schizosaccharomyces osmophilus TaxID=2545709 RepID=A0AAE9WDC2_9SCHI|nr:multicopy membrane protein [Schizosaccharomyces osmophilus]WBW73783.1 multicopy membrane protein [Schizosaccharomyces osmophilus]
MLFSSWISALLFTGSVLASLPYDPHADGPVSYDHIDGGNGASDSPSFVEDETLAVFPVDTSSNVQAFTSWYLINPIENEPESAYAKIYLKPNVNGTVHFRSIFYPDLFQAYKHAIDGSKDFEFIKSLVPKSNESFLEYSLSSGVTKSYRQPFREPGIHLFVGYQELPEDTESFLQGESVRTKSQDEYDPIMHVRYRSGDLQDSTPFYRSFVFLSVISSCIGLYWLIHLFRNPQKITFTHCLLLGWYIAFLFNHPIKQSLFSNKDFYETHGNFALFSMFFSYSFGNGIERSLFNSFILAFALGMGYVRHSSKKLISLVTLVGWTQLAFITIAPFIFPVLFIVGSPKAKYLQAAWMLFNFGYIPSVMFIGQFLACRKGLTLVEAKSTNFAMFVVFTVISTLVSIIIFVNSTASFEILPEVMKILIGVMFFCVVAINLNRREKVLKDGNSSNLQEPLPSYKDDPETDLPAADKKLPVV